MRAQSWRKILGLVNAVLLLGVVGAGAWWATKGRAAEAAGTKPAEWIPKAFATYQTDAKGARAKTIYPVDADAFKSITRSDDWMNPPDKGGPYVWPYVGPVPPPRRSIEPVKADAGPPPPSGLDVIGKPIMLYSVNEGPDGGTRAPGGAPTDSPLIVTFQFKDATSKPAVAIARGEFFVPNPKAENAKGRFRLTDGRRVDEGSDRIVELVYDVVDEAGKVERSETKRFTLASDTPKVSMVTPPGGATTPGRTPDGRVIPVDDGKAPDVATVKIVVEQTSPSSRRVAFDEIAYRYGSRTDMEKMLSDVKTKDAVDASGKASGVELTGVNPGSLAAQFEIKPGDVLKSIAGKPVHSRAEAVEVVKNLPKETTSVQAVIERNGRQITYDVDARDPRVRAMGGKVRYEK